MTHPRHAAIAAALKAKGWSYAELGRRIGVGRHTPRLWVSGKITPTLEHAEALARALDLDPATLFPARARKHPVLIIRSDGVEALRLAITGPIEIEILP